MTDRERDEAIEKIWETVRDIQVNMARLSASCPPCKDTLSRVVESVDGNGQTGLKTRVKILETHVTWIWAVVGGLATATATIALKVLDWWLRS